MTKLSLKKENVKELLFLTLLVFAAIAVSVDKNSQNAVKDGIYLWAAAVLPALFPYLVITSLVSSLKITGKISAALSPFTEKLWGVNGNCGYALFISLMSGYPVGAKCVSDLKIKGLTGDAESVRAAALCSSSSPVFLIGSVGNLTFNSPLFGLLLFITHIISVFSVGFLFSFYKRQERPVKATPAPRGGSDNVCYESVYQAVISVLVVGGIVAAVAIPATIGITNSANVQNDMNAGANAMLNLDGSNGNNENGAVEDDRCLVDLMVTVEHNYKFGKYNVDVVVDGETVATLGDKETFNQQLRLTPGKHTFSFQENGNPSNHTDVAETVTADTSFTYSLKRRAEYDILHGYGIEVSKK